MGIIIFDLISNLYEGYCVIGYCFYIYIQYLKSKTRMIIHISIYHFKVFFLLLAVHVII